MDYSINAHLYDNPTTHCLHPSTPPVPLLLLLATAAALLLEAAVAGACVGVLLLSAFSDELLADVAGAMLSLLSGRRAPFEPAETCALLVRGSLLLAAAEATERPPRLLWPWLPAEAADNEGAELALAVVLQLLAPCWEPALLSRLTGR